MTEVYTNKKTDSILESVFYLFDSSQYITIIHGPIPISPNKKIMYTIPLLYIYDNFTISISF